MLLQPSGEGDASQDYIGEQELPYLSAELFITFSFYARIARR
jgi:hypothetical protein